MPDIASVEEIKDKHRKLILEYHPDRHQESNDREAYEEKVKEINNSYKIIMNYCSRYPVSFKKEKVKDAEESEYMEDYLRRFYDGWVSDSN